MFFFQTRGFSRARNFCFKLDISTFEFENFNYNSENFYFTIPTVKLEISSSTTEPMSK